MKKVIVFFLMALAGLSNVVMAQEVASVCEADATKIALISSLSDCSSEEATKLLQEAQDFVAQARKAGKTDAEILAACKDVYTKEIAATGTCQACDYKASEYPRC